MLAKSIQLLVVVWLSPQPAWYCDLASTMSCQLPALIEAAAFNISSRCPDPGRVGLVLIENWFDSSILGGVPPLPQPGWAVSALGQQVKTVQP